LAFLGEFTEDQRDLLVSLPYRAGRWVSESDDSGGDESAESEMQVLEGLITGYAEDFLKSEFVEELMRETLARKDDWDAWSGNLDDVPRQCREAITMLGERIEQKHALSFRQNLMEIAKSVAMAYREEGEDEEYDSAPQVSPFTRQYWDRLFARLKGEAVVEDWSPNISKAERRVLMELSNALQVDLDGNPLSDAAAA